MKKINHEILLLVIILIVISILLFNGIYIPCIFHEITGLYCPGCGITRLFLSLLTFDFYQAYRYNQLVFILLPFTLILIIDYLFKTLTNKKNILYHKINNKVWYLLILLTILFGIVRNIPNFDYFIPTTL